MVTESIFLSEEPLEAQDQSAVTATKVTVSALAEQLDAH